MPTSANLDVLVIGAGQAGLALAWHLRGPPLSALLVDRAERVGDSWRNRYDSLTLFSPRALSALPGMRMPGDPDGYPSKDEVADYLAAYARQLRVPIALRTRIRRLSRAGDRFLAETDAGGEYRASSVVIATGAFQEPIIPPCAPQFAPDVVQLTAATYRDPGPLRGSRVLVVGDGATGRQLALELAGVSDVWLATGRRRVVTAQRILGRDQLWWSEKLGLLRASRRSLIGKLVRRLDAFPGEHLRLSRLRRQGVKVVRRLQDAGGRSALFSDGSFVDDVDAVVWAVGYRERTDWIGIADAKDDAGRCVEHRGVSVVPGLYFVGRDWQWSRGSALLVGVGRDAARVARSLARRTAPQFGGEGSIGGEGSRPFT
jgi:putative flavoprotein involved in K+ transport